MLPAPRSVSPRPPSRLFEDDQQVVISSSPATTSFPGASVVNLVPETSAAPFDAWVTKHEFKAYKKEHFSMLNKILVMQHNMEEMLVDLKTSTGAPSREPLPEGAPQLPLKAEVEVHHGSKCFN
nr:uncharacterized protein LOC122268787 [Parasteatoda tepidariorum]